MSSYSFIPIPKLQRIEQVSILGAKGKQQWRRLTGTGFDEISWRSGRRPKGAAFTKRHAVSITEYATCMYNAIITYRRDWDVSDARVFVPTTCCWHLADKFETNLSIFPSVVFGRLSSNVTPMMPLTCELYDVCGRRSSGLMSAGRRVVAEPGRYWRGPRRWCCK